MTKEKLLLPSCIALATSVLVHTQPEHAINDNSDKPREVHHEYIGIWGLHRNVLTRATKPLDAGPEVNASVAQFIQVLDTHHKKNEIVYPTADGTSVVQWHRFDDESVRIWPTWTKPNTSTLLEHVQHVKMVGLNQLLTKRDNKWEIRRSDHPEAAVEVSGVPEETLMYGAAEYANSQLQCGFKIAISLDVIAADCGKGVVRIGNIDWDRVDGISWRSEIRLEVQSVKQVVTSSCPPFVGVVTDEVLRLYCVDGKPIGVIDKVGTLRVGTAPNTLLSCDDTQWFCIKLSDNLEEKTRTALNEPLHSVVSIDPSCSIVTGYKQDIGSRYYRKMFNSSSIQRFPPMQEPAFMWLRLQEEVPG